MKAEDFEFEEFLVSEAKDLTFDELDLGVGFLQGACGDPIGVVV